MWCAARTPSAPPSAEDDSDGGAPFPEHEAQLWLAVFEQSVTWLREPHLAARWVTGLQWGALGVAARAAVVVRVRERERWWWRRGGTAQWLCRAFGWNYEWMRGRLEAEGLLPREEGRMGIDVFQQVRAVRREIALRRRVYARLVAARKMTETAAQLGIEEMEAVLATLERIAAPGADDHGQ